MRPDGSPAASFRGDLREIPQWALHFAFRVGGKDRVGGGFEQLPLFHGYCNLTTPSLSNWAVQFSP